MNLCYLALFIFVCFLTGLVIGRFIINARKPKLKEIIAVLIGWVAVYYLCI